MLELFHVSYLMTYPWMQDDEGPDCLVSVRFLAEDKKAALKLAKTQIETVLAVYTDPEDEADEEGLEIVVRAWDEWGAKLDKNWADICSTEAEDTAESDDEKDDDPEEGSGDGADA
ncbi:MAG: hypothetical protein WC869_01090 [Phycisphaerae bacterium]|jgi:hypothetical protein